MKVAVFGVACPIFLLRAFNEVDKKFNLTHSLQWCDRYSGRIATVPHRHMLWPRDEGRADYLRGHSDIGIEKYPEIFYA